MGIDEIAVERAMHGDPVRLTAAERREVTARLTRLGYSGRQIADRLHISARQVFRHRAAREVTDGLREAA